MDRRTRLTQNELEQMLLEETQQSTEVSCITLPADESVLDLDPLPTVNKDQTHLDLCGVNVTITPLYDAVSGTNAQNPPR